MEEIPKPAAPLSFAEHAKRIKEMRETRLDSEDKSYLDAARHMLELAFSIPEIQKSFPDLKPQTIERALQEALHVSKQEPYDRLNEYDKAASKMTDDELSRLLIIAATEGIKPGNGYYHVALVDEVTDRMEKKVASWQ
jgi:hypothetical protein